MLHLVASCQSKELVLRMRSKTFHGSQLGYAVFQKLAQHQQLVPGAKGLQIGQVLFFLNEYCRDLRSHVSLKNRRGTRIHRL